LQIDTKETAINSLITNRDQTQPILQEVDTTKVKTLNGRQKPITNINLQLLSQFPEAL